MPESGGTETDVKTAARHVSGDVTPLLERIEMLRLRTICVHSQRKGSAAAL